MRNTVLLALGAFLLASGARSDAQEEAPAPLELEESDKASLPVFSPHWIIAENNWAGGASRIFDGNTGKMLGQVSVSQLASFASDPLGRYFYVAETIWTKGTRGKRQDMLTVRDARTLDVLSEIPLPGRLLVGNRRFTLGVSADGRYAFTYNMDPASSVTIVDLEKRRLVTTVEVPGCGLTTGFGKSASVSLCSDGTATLVATPDGKRGEIKPSTPFFSADSDPVFDNFAVNSVAGEAVFLSYSGKVTPARVDGDIKLGESWSLQQAAGYAAGSTEPMVMNWYPGGRQPLAYNKAIDRIFVLMHKGEYWSQKQPAEELWVFEASTRKLLKRVKLEGSIEVLEVSQDGEPLLYLGSDESLLVWDAQSLEEKHEIADAHVVMLSVPVSGW